MNADSIWGVARTILAGVGGYFVAKGQIDDSTLQQLLGGIGTLFVAAWSIYSKVTAKPAA